MTVINFTQLFVILLIIYRYSKSNGIKPQKYCKQMERIQVLIEKLQQQYQQKENAASMLLTLQILHNELTALQNGNKVLGTAKVAVVMPNVPAFNKNFQEVSIDHSDKREELFKAVPEIKQQPKPVETLRKEENLTQKPSESSQQPAVSHNVPLFDMHIDSVVEAPTLVQQHIHKEVNELIANNKESLNDRLKQEQKEIAHILKDSPVKDLRKAIGVNDKFVFISELFRGDEAMYERSIKTINTFHILAEAEYWMNRELKVKLGWNDLNDTVQHFYQLVRRRFS